MIPQLVERAKTSLEERDFPVLLKIVTLKLPLTIAKFQLGEISYTCKMATQVRAR